MEENKKEGNTAPKAETEKQKATPADQDQVATASESATTKVSENKQGAVSYTHLDVYKRQEEAPPHNWPAMFLPAD